MIPHPFCNLRCLIRWAVEAKDALPDCQRELHQLPLHRGRAAFERDQVDHGEVVVEHGPEGREEPEGGVRHPCLQPAQRPRADRVQGGHQLLLRHRPQEVRHEGLHLDAVQAVLRNGDVDEELMESMVGQTNQVLPT